MQPTYNRDFVEMEQIVQLPSPEPQVSETSGKKSKRLDAEPVNPIVDMATKILDEPNTAFSAVSTAIGVTKLGCSVAAEFTKLPKDLKMGLKWTKFAAVPNFIFAGAKTVKNIDGAIKAKTATQKTEKIAKAVLSTSKMAKNGLTFVKALQTFEVITDDLPGMEIAAAVLFPFKAIGIGFSVKGLVDNSILCHEMNKNITLTDSSTKEENRVEQMKRATKYVKANHKKIAKGLGLSKDCELKERMKPLIKNLKSENREIQKKAVEDSEKMMKTLKTRMGVKLGFNAASTAMKITSFVLGALALILAFSNPVTVWIGIAFSIAGLAMMIASHFALKSNPWVHKPEWYEQFAATVQKYAVEFAQEMKKAAQRVGQAFESAFNSNRAATAA